MSFEAFEVVSKALESLQLHQQYFTDFKDKKMHDVAVQKSISSFFDTKLKKVIPNGDHRKTFITTFDKIFKDLPDRTHGRFPGQTSLPDSSSKTNSFSSDDGVLKAALVIATKFYKEKMEQEFAAQKFLPQFDSLCIKTTAEALASCRKEIPLTRHQENRLVTAMKAVQLEYKEKNYQRAPQKSLAIGIDLGTTYSCVSICRNGKVEIIPNEIGKYTTPSCVAFRPDGLVKVGSIAKHAAFEDPQNTSFDAKRLIGRNFSDLEVQSDLKVWPFRVVKSDEADTPKVLIHGKTYFAEEISARILQYMKKIAENYLGCEVKNAVVTVPAYFNNGQRQATKDAGEIAGLNILKIINEPTAAAIAYNLHRTDDLKKNVLIFDLGGGTLDVALITVSGGEIRNLVVGGDTHLGGQDFDNEMVNHCITAFKEKHKIDLTAISTAASSRALRRIRNECEQEKINLSATEETVISIYAIYEGHDLHVPFTRQEFNDLCRPKFDKCLEAVELVVKESGLNKEEIDDIVLVGGSSRIPKIQEMLSDLFDGEFLNKSLNPDETVAHGAAVEAAILNGMQGEELKSTQKTLFVSDVTPFSLGVEVYPKKDMCVVVPKQTVIPCKRKHEFITYKDYQTKICFQIFEGENPVAKKNNLLGTFVLENIPSAKSGVEVVELTIEINVEGILHAKAIVDSNRSYNSITIKAYQGRLSKEQISQLKEAQEDGGTVNFKE